MTPTQAFQRLNGWTKVIGFVVSLIALAGLVSSAAIKLADVAPAPVVQALAARVSTLEVMLESESRKTDRMLCLLEAIAEDRTPPPSCIR